MPSHDAVYRFGPFELRTRTRELYKNGIRLKVRPQPFQVLLALLAHSGDIVTREELRRLLWSAETFVDFEHGLNTAIKELRGLLNDSVGEPRYIETLPKLGYRAIVPVTQVAPVHAAKAKEKNATTPVASVAVLPFVNLSADPENEFFADGITEDIITHLVKIKSLKVISRTSVMAFKTHDCGLREIGERLGASALLEGSVRRAGSRVRIVAQLVDGATDKHLWAETYDRELTDIFAIQTDVALNIASALRAELSHEERARVGRPPTHDLGAYELYLHGRNWFNQFTDEGYRRSLLDYRAAIARDPGFALAWASIAEANSELCIGGGVGESPEETILFAKEAATRALEIDQELGEAHSTSALIKFAFDFDWVGGSGARVARLIHRETVRSETWKPSISRSP
jgi:TolB-like protein